MKKIFALILVLAMVLSLCACGKQEAAEPETLGQTLYKDFTTKVDAGEKDPQALADAILSSGLLPFDGLSAEVVPGWLMGFTADIEGFEKAVMFGPAIGAIPFVGYVFQLDSADSCEAFCAKLLENADPRWNICTEADETVCGSAENLVFFVMCSNESAE